jgi:hypothetical protein
MAVSAPPKKPVQAPLFDASAEPRARPDEWRLDDPPPSVGTLPREIYQALCVLRATGPRDARALGQAIMKSYDWDLYACHARGDAACVLRLRDDEQQRHSVRARR